MTRLPEDPVRSAEDPVANRSSHPAKTGIASVPLQLGGRRIRSWWERYGNTAALWIIALLLVPMSHFVSSGFPSSSQIYSVLELGLFLLIVSFGQGLVLVTGGIDLSVPATIGASATIVAGMTSGGTPTWLAIVIALLVCAGIGLANGLGVGFLNVPPFIMTLAIAVITENVLLGITNGGQAKSSPAVLANLFVRSAKLGGIRVPIILFILMVGVGWILQHRTGYARRLYVVGSSPNAAYLAGSSVKWIRATVYVISAISFAIAGVLLLGFSGNAQLTVGDAYLLPSLAAVLVGGTAITGGRGAWLGTVAGVVLLTLISVDLTATGLPSGWIQVLYGAVVFITLVLTSRMGTPSIRRSGMR